MKSLEKDIDIDNTKITNLNIQEKDVKILKIPFHGNIYSFSTSTNASKIEVHTTEDGYEWNFYSQLILTSQETLTATKILALYNTNEEIIIIYALKDNIFLARSTGGKVWKIEKIEIPNDYAEKSIFYNGGPVDIMLNGKKELMLCKNSESSEEANNFNIIGSCIFSEDNGKTWNINRDLYVNDNNEKN